MEKSSEHLSSELRGSEPRLTQTQPEEHFKILFTLTVSSTIPRLQRQLSNHYFHTDRISDSDQGASVTIKMADTDSIYDEIEIEDMTFDAALELYHFPCPCGDRFEISLGDLREGEEIAVCPSCSLMIRVVFDQVCLP